jgi:hypothetical protein
MVNIEDNRTPVMFDREIDELAHAILGDYRPELLKEPGKIDFEHFLESYLGAEIQYHDIYCADPKYPVLALTAFTAGGIDVFDRKNECLSTAYVPARTVVIDNAVIESDIVGFARFSALHEAGHLILHWRVFVDGYGVPYKGKNNTASVIICRRDNIEIYGNKGKHRTPADWREHQADYFAAAAAMPNVTFYPFVNQLLRENGIYKRQIRLGRDSDLDIFADDLLPEFISETYGVSKRAARIKLRKAEFVLGDKAQNAVC